MEDSTASLIGLFLSLTCGAISASIAAPKRRTGVGWFFLGMLFGPIALMIIVVAPPLPDPDAADGSDATRSVDALAKLADLRDRGAITSEEFETEKARLMGRPRPPTG